MISRDEHVNLLIAAGCTKETAEAQRTIMHSAIRQFANDIASTIDRVPDIEFSRPPHEIKTKLKQLLKDSLK